MESVKYHTEKLIAALKESDSYQKYEEVREEIAKDPELKRQLDEYRKKWLYQLTWILMSLLTISTCKKDNRKKEEKIPLIYLWGVSRF